MNFVYFQHVVLLCGMDVDSLCACKALQALFMADDVGHTVIPVAGKEDMRSAYNEHADQVRQWKRGQYRHPLSE